jgi:formylglycine-generating enzyme required for sulfatase activity
MSGPVKTPTQSGAPVPSQSFETTISPTSGSQNFETTISPSSPSQSFETTISPTTGGHQLQQTGEAATEFISRVKVAPEPVEPAAPKQTGESATEVIPRAKVTAEPAQGTELLTRSEDARGSRIAPVEPARNLESGKAAPPADKPDKKKEEKKEKEKKAEKKEEKKAAASPVVKKPGTTTTGTAPIYKNPFVIGGGAVVSLLAMVVIWAVWPRSQPKIDPQPNTPTPVVVVIPPGMVLVPGGEFSMGRDGITDNRLQFEKPAHTVTVDPFFMDLTEVTNEQYQKFVDQTGHPPPPIWQGNHFPDGANTLPVTDVTWEDAKAYAQWAGDGKRLPTEAEWEFAARGTDGRIYPWGPEWLANVSNTKNDQGKMVLVKQFPKGVSKAGLFDMSGNAWEWTDSEFKEYPGGPAYAPPEGYKNLKVIRGGAYDSPPEFATATVRVAYPATRNDWIEGVTPDYTKTGFRLAKSAPKQQ